MIGRELAGYRIEAQIGQSEIAVVYRALDLELDKQVALKLPRAGAGGPEPHVRFERDLSSLATLVHPGIVAILDCGVSDSVPFIVMELLEGRTLVEALGGERFGWERARHVTLDVLSALAYLHGRGLVHGELSARGVFLERLPDGAERAKLLDCGLSRPLGEADAREDVYGVAALCFELIAGVKPQAGPPLLHEACPDRVARPELERALQRGLSVQASDRPTALELRAELEAVPEPWCFEARDATRERRKAAAQVRAELRRSRASERAQALEPKAGPLLTPERVHRLAIAGAWLLALGALAVIAITAATFYASSDAAHPEARELLAGALPTLQAATPAPELPSDGGAPHAPELESPAPSVARADSARASAPRVPARNPWREAIPRELRPMRWKLEIGQEGDREMIKDLRRYVRRHDKDPRGALLLARLYANRDAWNDAVGYYKLAFDRDASSRGDPRMLKDLVKAVARKESSWRASELIPVVYGTDALPEIKRVLARTHDNEERLRLEQLAHTLRPVTSPAQLR